MRVLAVLLAAQTLNWPMFRGPEAAGVAEGPAALHWNADTSAGPAQNIRWKTPLPGLSHSSPIVWGDKLYVATAVSAVGNAPLRVGLYGDGDSANDNGEQSWQVYCLDKRTGKVLWSRIARQGAPKSRRHTKATHANSTLATDGRRLVAWFGSEGLFVYDLSGKPLWQKDLGTFDVGPQGYDLQWGVASSPVIFEDIILLQCDQKKGSFLVALDAGTGSEKWRTPRDGVSNQSWSTPAVVRAAGRTQVVTNGWPFIAGYDFATGKELWRLRAGGDIPVPTPVFAHGLIFVTNAHGGQAPLFAIKPDAAGDISPAKDATTSTGVVWSVPRNGAYMQTPLIAGDLLYSCSDRGVLKVYDARTGELRYQQRLGEGTTGFSSSPIAADGRIYFASEEGDVYVLKLGPQYELLATNHFGEITMATPAYSEGVLFYRTRGHLVAVGGEADPRSTGRP